MIFFPVNFSLDNRREWHSRDVLQYAPTVILLLIIFLTQVTYASSHNKANTPVEHIITLMQENHSFDNYFGTYPGADGIPPDTCIPVNPFDASNTDCVRPFHIGDNDVKMADPDHSEGTHITQYNKGAMNGFVHALNERNQDGRLAMGYYDDRDLPYHWNIADEYVLFDQFFSSVAGGSFPNHMYWVAAVSGKEEGRPTQEIMKEKQTIFDALEEKDLSWKFYIQNYDPNINYRTAHLYSGNRLSQVIWAPVLNIDRFLDDPELNSRIVELNEYFVDLKRGTLPNVAFMVPSGPSEHPPQSLVSGQRFIRSLIQALMASSYWEKSVFTWTYDDWGGWYDHVPPPQVDKDGYGFRVPALLVSPYAKRGYIDSTILDYTSILKFIQENWDIEPLAERDANANGLAGAFDFTQSPREPEIIPFERFPLPVKPQPRRSVIYVLYSLAILLAVALIVLPMVSRR